MITRILCVCVILLAIASPLSALGGEREPAILETDICTLYAKPAGFRNRIVRVRAHLHMVVEGAILSDESLKCVVMLRTARAVQDDADIKRAWADGMDASKDVTGTVTGQFLLRRSRGRTVRIIDAIKITDLKVTPVKLVPKR